VRLSLFLELLIVGRCLIRIRNGVEQQESYLARDKRRLEPFIKLYIDGIGTVNLLYYFRGQLIVVVPPQGISEAEIMPLLRQEWDVIAHINLTRWWRRTGITLPLHANVSPATLGVQKWSRSNASALNNGAAWAVPPAKRCFLRDLKRWLDRQNWVQWRRQ